jgi:DNA-binding CsgD family transcriptional regulator
MSEALRSGALGKVIEQLGEAVIDPALWPDILERICGAVNANAAMLVQGEFRTPDVPRTASMEDGVRLYFDQGWHNRDLLGRGVPRLLNGEKVYFTQDVATPEEMRREAFFHEVLYRHGVKWSAVVGLRAGAALWCMSLQRTARQGAFDANDKQVFEELSERLTEVATLSAVVGQVALTSSLNALEFVRQPTVAIDSFGCILQSNAAAEAIFDDSLRVHMRRLIVGDSRAKSDLEALFAQLRLASGGASVPLEPVVVRKHEKAPTLIRPLPISGAARAPFLGACALLVFVDCSRRRPPSAALLARTFGLSPAEARTAALFATGLSTEEVADVAGLSRQTIKSQLKLIFSKTGAHRQAELVLRLSSLSGA